MSILAQDLPIPQFHPGGWLDPYNVAAFLIFLCLLLLYMIPRLTSAYIKVQRELADLRAKSDMSNKSIDQNTAAIGRTNDRITTVALATNPAPVPATIVVTPPIVMKPDGTPRGTISGLVGDNAKGDPSDPKDS